MGFFWWLELGKAPKQAYFIETPKQGVFVGFEPLQWASFWWLELGKAPKQAYFIEIGRFCGF